MKIFPWDYYDIQTSLNRERLVESLRTEVEPKKWLRFSRVHKTFEGQINGEGFKIMRIINYRNSFLPIIYGSFEQGDKGTLVKIKMKLHLFVFAFMCLWFVGVGVGIFVAGAGIITKNFVFSPFLLIPFGLFFFGWLLVSGCFCFEAKKARALLDDIMLQKGT